MAESTPICRCRVLYLGSSVPQQTKDGLQGIQEPLQELYPDQGGVDAKGIDSWLSVWSNGILLENVDENHKKITRFFPIESLHYCAAVRYVLVPEKNTLHTPTPRFLPLDSPFARTPNPTHPPLFAAILRRITGIKVLECHAFICKREVAANALVRCCFHAYADSSYAKQVDTVGSIYGTLANEHGMTSTPILANKEKMLSNEWKNRSMAGSTMTINTITKDVDNEDDDGVSIYNGDENHKVWAGSQDNLDAIYDVYATSTISRPSRPRQIARPLAVVPPPPPPPPLGAANEMKGKKKKKMVARNQRDDLIMMTMNQNGRPTSSMAGGGTLLKHHRPPPPPTHHHYSVQSQPIYVMPPPSSVLGAPSNNNTLQQTLPNPKYFNRMLQQHGNTYAHRPRQTRMLVPMVAGTPTRPPLVPLATLQKSRKLPKTSNKHVMEEPIYMPSNRALSPIASYQPINFPHEAYLMQHYATMDNGGAAGVGNAANKTNTKQQTKRRERKLNRKLAQSMNGLDDPGLADGDVEGGGGGGGSPFNTGIYRKKGHLNERAFSYSIRQEHRSRSYGSLANLKFATPIPNDGGDGEDREDLKKEREIMQMVQDLDLSGDELERIEVPRGMYGLAPPPPPPITQHSHPMMTAATPTAVPVLVNGRAHRR